MTVNILGALGCINWMVSHSIDGMREKNDRGLGTWHH